MQWFLHAISTDYEVTGIPSLRVLQVHNSGCPDLPSGEDVVVASEAEWLRESGLSVEQYICHHGIDHGRTGSVAALGRSMIGPRRHYSRLRTLVREFRPDVAHFHSVLPSLNLAGFRACRAEGVPVIQTLHNYRWLCVEGGMFRRRAFCDRCVVGSPLNGIRFRCCRDSVLASTLLTFNNYVNRVTRRLHGLVSRFIAVSDYVRSVHLAGGFAADKLDVKYNGVDLSSESSQRLPRNNRVVFAGRMSPSKGTDVVGDLVGELNSAEFHLVGSGPELARLQERASKYSHVHIHGRIERPKLLELMRSAQCVVVPSTFPEPFGLTAIEAMAMGTPVVASRIGGLTELVEGSQGGILVDVQEGAHGFARAINTLLADPQLARRLGENGREFAQTRCSAEVTTKQLIEIYADVCQAAHRPAAVAVT